MIRHSRFSACLVLCLAAVGVQAQVSVNINVVPGVVMVAPPPPRAERMPGPRAGQVWVPGHWRWTGRDYDWRGGTWVADRPDYAYAPGRWVQADGGWRWVEGDWRRGGKHDKHDDKHEGGYHCPPGQAKKGRC